MYCRYRFNIITYCHIIFIKFCQSGEILEIKSGKYAVFSFPYELQNVAKFWGEIWKYFEGSKLKRAYETDFELYGSDGIKIYISVLD